MMISQAVSQGFLTGMLLLYMWNNVRRKSRPIPKKIHLFFSAATGFSGLTVYWGGELGWLAAGAVFGILGYSLLLLLVFVYRRLYYR